MIIREIPADYTAGKTENEIRTEIQKLLATIREPQKNYDREKLVRAMRQGERQDRGQIHQRQR